MVLFLSASGVVSRAVELPLPAVPSSGAEFVLPVPGVPLDGSHEVEPILPAAPHGDTPPTITDSVSLPAPAVTEDRSPEDQVLSILRDSREFLRSGGTESFLSSVAGFEVELSWAPVAQKDALSAPEDTVSDLRDDSAEVAAAEPAVGTSAPAAPLPPTVITAPRESIPAPAPVVRPSSPSTVSPVRSRSPIPEASQSPVISSSVTPAPVSPAQRSVDRIPSQVAVPGQPVGDAQTFTVRLPGRGWVFLDGPAGVAFHSRSRGQNEEIFTFRAVESAQDLQSLDGELLFQQQDLTEGVHRTHREEINFNTLTVAATQSSSEISHLPDGTGTSGSGSLDTSNSVLSREEFAEQWPDLDPEQREFARRVLETAENHPPVEQVVLLVSALELVEYSDAELIFRLARLLEQAGPARDIERSHRLYQRVRDDFPFSPHRETSRQRIEFLERHFLLIR